MSTPPTPTLAVIGAGLIGCEYANDLAVHAATEQVTSEGAVASGFGAWLDARKAQFPGYDPDAAFAALEQRLAAGEDFPLRLE